MNVYCIYSYETGISVQQLEDAGLIPRSVDELELMILEGDSVNGQSLLLKNIEEIKSNFPDTYSAKFVLLAECYGSLGMVDDCLVNLRKGMSGPMHYYSIYHSPLMDPIRHEVQFQQLLKQLKAKNDESRKRILSKKYFL